MTRSDECSDAEDVHAQRKAAQAYRIGHLCGGVFAVYDSTALPAAAADHLEIAVKAFDLAAEILHGQVGEGTRRACVGERQGAVGARVRLDQALRRQSSRDERSSHNGGSSRRDRFGRLVCSPQLRRVDGRPLASGR